MNIDFFFFPLSIWRASGHWEMKSMLFFQLSSCPWSGGLRICDGLVQHSLLSGSWDEVRVDGISRWPQIGRLHTTSQTTERYDSDRSKCCLPTSPTIGLKGKTIFVEVRFTHPRFLAHT